MTHMSAINIDAAEIAVVYISKIDKWLVWV